MMILSKSGNNENHFKGDAVSAWMMELVAEEKAARKKEKISNFDLKSIIGAFTDLALTSWSVDGFKVALGKPTCTNCAVFFKRGGGGQTHVQKFCCKYSVILKGFLPT